MKKSSSHTTDIVPKPVVAIVEQGLWSGKKRDIRPEFLNNLSVTIS